MTIPTSAEVRGAVTTLLAEVAWARAPGGLLAQLAEAIRRGDSGVALARVHRLGDLLAVLEAAVTAVQLPEDES